MQQSRALEHFDEYRFNLEVSFYDLQFEHVKEVPTNNIPSFLSQIGGQFGFFLGLSIITMIQMAIYFITKLLNLFYQFFLPIPIQSETSQKVCLQHFER